MAAPYYPTESDIQRLNELGFDTSEIFVGESPLNQSELEALFGSVIPTEPDVIPETNIQPASSNVAPEVTLGIDPAGNPILPPEDSSQTLTLPTEDAVSADVPLPSPPAGPQPTPDVKVSTSGNTDMQALMMQMLKAQQQPPADPYDNLSKTQRRMLAFAAIQDAGMALQGKAGGNVDALLKDFTNRADQQRKREASLRQSQMLMGLMQPGGSAGAFDMSTVEGNRAMAQQIANMIMVNPGMADALAAKMEFHLKEAERLQQEDTVRRGQAEGAGFVLETSAELRQMIENNPNITGIKGMLLSVIPTTEAAEARLDVETLRSRMALSALLNIKEKGATLGQVSNQELALLQADIAALNLNQSADAVLRDLSRIDKRYQGIVQNLYADNANNERGTAELDRIFGGRPGYVTQGDAPAVQQYNIQNVPEGEVFQSRNGEIWLYLGGDRKSSDSYRRLKGAD
jgi:hypothetical protein